MNTDNSEHIDFGVTDRLNRAMGLFVTKWNPGDVMWRLAQPETTYSYRTQVSRNGKPHQASHSSKSFETAEARDADLERNIKQARKRALSPGARLKA